MVIAKGGGNFETLIGEPELSLNQFFLLMCKCAIHSRFSTPLSDKQSYGPINKYIATFKNNWWCELIKFNYWHFLKTQYVVCWFVWLKCELIEERLIDCCINHNDQKWSQSSNKSIKWIKWIKWIK